MSLFDTDNIFNNLAIRDTSQNISNVSNSKTFDTKTIAIINDLNQTVSIQLQGAIKEDFSKIFNIGNSFDISANSTGFQNSNTYFPYLRLTAICNVAPTSGTLSAYFLKKD